MANILIYKRDTGEIFGEHWGHPNDTDPLTKERQLEMLASMYPEEFYEVGMVVSEGDNSVFIPDVVERKEVVEERVRKKKDGTFEKVKLKKNKKFIKSNQLSKINKLQKQRPE